MFEFLGVHSDAWQTNCDLHSESRMHTREREREGGRLAPVINNANSRSDVRRRGINRGFLGHLRYYSTFFMRFK